MNKINLAIVTGGHAAEKEISLKSANVVFNNIDKQKYNTFLVDICTMPLTAT